MMGAPPLTAERGAGLDGQWPVQKWFWRTTSNGPRSQNLMTVARCAKVLITTGVG